jgi:hypothetical protein
MPPSSDPSGVSYDIHTNRELEFMLERGKPFAHFCDDYPSEPNEDIIPELAFAPYVESGIFEKREYVEPLIGRAHSDHPHIRGIRYVLYARACEAWRIDAYIMLKNAAARAGWSEGFERLEGALLGYEEWQTDAHLDRSRHSSQAKDLNWLRKPSP